MSKPIIFGESVQGASHKRTDTECQDSYGVRELTDGTVILAVADGHGSKLCPYSSTGSRIAADVFCEVMTGICGKYSGEYDSLMTYLNREGETTVAKDIDLLWKKRIIREHRKNLRKMPPGDSKEEKRTQVYTMYGTTLLGVLVTKAFLFAYQLGDGDIIYVDNDAANPVLSGEKFLGTDTHSLSSKDSWKQAISGVRVRGDAVSLPHVFMLSTDGFANSYKDEQEFHKTCTGYFNMIREHGAGAVRSNLGDWLAETSELGCGDDITLLLAYFA